MWGQVRSLYLIVFAAPRNNDTHSKVRGTESTGIGYIGGRTPKYSRFPVAYYGDYRLTWFSHGTVVVVGPAVSHHWV